LLAKQTATCFFSKYASDHEICLPIRNAAFHVTLTAAAVVEQGYYDTMDAGFLTEDGNIAVMARSDDVINVAGHRLSAGALEEVVDAHR